MKINELRDNAGASKRRKRVGRGSGSGRGGTSGRGMKGQKSRSGVALGGFEGGQMPLYQRLPKRGFNNPSRKRFAEVNLGALQKFIDAGSIDPESVIDEKILVESGLVRRLRDGVRILAGGEFAASVEIVVSGASRPAVAAVAAAGGVLMVDQEKASGQDLPKPESATN